ncbi:MAG: DNA replication/repair protein RecF [Acutalibacteraceae bacterium]
MIVQDFLCENFRNLHNEKIAFSNGINVLCGDNAQGKTNLIEGLWLFTGGKSFRGAKDGELVAFEQPFAKLTAAFHAQQREQLMQITIQNSRRRIVLNDVPKRSASQVVGCFCAVVFAPNHLMLVKSGPEERRRFIDAAICQIQPQYARILSQYQHILSQRNTLLKDIPNHRELEDTLEIWNERLSASGTQIIRYRRAYIKKLAERASLFYDGISGTKEQMTTEYQTACCDKEVNTAADIQAEFLQKLNEVKRNDILAGFTTNGPHRDDINIKINGHDAKSFGSQGQQRSAVLALKLAEADLLGESKGEQPIILLDDVLSELDTARQDYLLNRLENRQVFITCCESDVLIKLKNRNSKVLKISGGHIFSER